MRFSLWKGPCMPSSLSLRGGQDGRRGNPSCLGGRVRGCLFVFWLTVDRHGLRPRDDKSEGSDDKSGMGRVLFVIARRERSERRGNPSCLEERGRGCLFGYLLTVDRHWLRPRDDNTLLCHCEEGAERETRQSIVSRRMWAELSVCLLRASGSPRASPTR